MISIGALLSKWQHVGEVYLQGHPNPASIRFADTCDLVIAEYELDNCSLALAAQFSSATKWKGQYANSHFWQTVTDQPAATKDAPDGEHLLKKKKIRCGGRRMQAKKVQAIVSNAFSPQTNAKWIQENHQEAFLQAAPALVLYVPYMYSDGWPIPGSHKYQIHYCGFVQAIWHDKLQYSPICGCASIHRMS